MCIIIDADVASNLQPPSSDAKPVIDSIQKRKMLLVIGGKNTEELILNKKVGQWLAELYRSNMVRIILEPDIEREEHILLGLGQRQSNDDHILALARASGARLLFSRDNDLAQDFKNRIFLNEPRGSVYKKRAHAHLLRSAVCTPKAGNS